MTMYYGSDSDGMFYDSGSLSSGINTFYNHLMRFIHSHHSLVLQ